MTPWRVSAADTVTDLMAGLDPDAATDTAAARALILGWAQALMPAGRSVAGLLTTTRDPVCLAWCGHVMGALRACRAFLRLPEPTREDALAAGQAVGLVLAVWPLLVPSAGDDTAGRTPGSGDG